MKSIAIAILLALSLALGGCAQPNVGASTPTPGVSTEQQGPRIVTSFYPMYVATLNVTLGTSARLANMAAPETGCLHDYQITTSDRKAIADADILVVNGAGMESFLDDVSRDVPYMVDASEGFTEIEDNPHIWVSPLGAMHQVQAIADGLSRSDPGNANAYQANAKAYIERIDALYQEMKQRLAPAVGRPIITFHEAFPYFAEAFDLDVVAVVEREPGSAPSPTELADVVNIVRDHPGVSLFAEPQYDRTAADVIARETGATVYTLDPVVTGPLDDPDVYLARMRQNLDVLVEAFGL